METVIHTRAEPPHVVVSVLATNGAFAEATYVTIANSLWERAVSREAATGDHDWVEFSKIAAEWKSETRYMSFVEDMTQTVAFKKLVEMGPERAIPLIVRQLELEGSRPRQWGLVLEALTGQNPVPAEHMGNVQEASRHWIEWARHYYGSHQ